MVIAPLRGQHLADLLHRQHQVAVGRAEPISNIPEIELVGDGDGDALSVATTEAVASLSPVPSPAISRLISLAFSTASCVGLWSEVQALPARAGRCLVSLPGCGVDLPGRNSSPSGFASGRQFPVWRLRSPHLPFRRVVSAAASILAASAGFGLLLGGLDRLLLGGLVLALDDRRHLAFGHAVCRCLVSPAPRLVWSDRCEWIG
jgi:hypothetical protein